MANDFSSWFTTLKRQTANQQWEDSGLHDPLAKGQPASEHQNQPSCGLTSPLVIGFTWAECSSSLHQWSQSVVPGSSASPGSLLDMQIFRPTPDLLSQKVWGWGPAICILPPGDSDVPLKTTGLCDFQGCPEPPSRSRGQ